MTDTICIRNTPREWMKKFAHVVRTVGIRSSRVIATSRECSLTLNTAEMTRPVMITTRRASPIRICSKNGKMMMKARRNARRNTVLLRRSGFDTS
jgi:hypothetical protein